MPDSPKVTRRDFLKSLCRTKVQRAIDYARLSTRGTVPELTDYDLSQTFGVSLDDLWREAEARR